MGVTKLYQIEKRNGQKGMLKLWRQIDVTTAGGKKSFLHQVLQPLTFKSVYNGRNALVCIAEKKNTEDLCKGN